MKHMRKTAAAFALSLPLLAVAAVPLATAGTAAAAPSRQSTTHQLVHQIAAQLGARDAGSYLDHGTLVVDVTDQAAANSVRTLGAQPRQVRHGGDELANAKRVFDTLAPVPNTSWGIDPVSDQVVLTVSDAASGPGFAQLLTKASSFGDLVQVRHSAAPMRQQSTATGDELQVVGNTGSWCSVGFDVTNGYNNYVLTAGHCHAANGWQTPYGQYIGQTVWAGPSGSDYSLVSDGLAPEPGNFTGAADAFVGESVCKRGATSGTTCGTVKAVDQTAVYSNGVTVYHLIQTEAITQGGDSGGGLYDGNTALGIVSGGDGSTVSSFYPVTLALQDAGVSLITSGP